ncbi:MAG: hypothetical protein LBT97_10280 [Planctomycetota bacterium]|nr:hypothetical protein [Planctomycetota bacterium]
MIDPEPRLEDLPREPRGCRRTAACDPGRRFQPLPDRSGSAAARDRE